MKINEVDIVCVKDYLHIDYDNDDLLIGMIMEAANAYIKAYTGLGDDSICTFDDLTIAYMILIADMYDNRDYHIQNDKVNKVVESIMGLHCINLL
jgi:uncharacterized phage protein (predicted DNA packaging)